MLRVKLEPDVQEWVERGQEIAQVSPPTLAAGLSTSDRNELWEWAPGAANAEARKQKWGADYTLAEKEQGIENVATGLKRELVEPPDDFTEAEDEEYEEVTDEDDEGQGDQVDVVEVRSKPGGQGLEVGLSTRPIVPQMPLETIHKFMMTGKAGG